MTKNKDHIGNCQVLRQISKICHNLGTLHLLSYFYGGMCF